MTTQKNRRLWTEVGAMWIRGSITRCCTARWRARDWTDSNPERGGSRVAGLHHPTPSTGCRPIFGRRFLISNHPRPLQPRCRAARAAGRTSPGSTTPRRRRPLPPTSPGTNTQFYWVRDIHAHPPRTTSESSGQAGPGPQESSSLSAR